MKIKIWNTQTFKHLQRHLIRWLEGDILECEHIRKIKRQITMRNENGVSLSWKKVRCDVDVMIMMLGPDDIVLMVFIF